MPANLIKKDVITALAARAAGLENTAGNPRLKQVVNRLLDHRFRETDQLRGDSVRTRSAVAWFTIRETRLTIMVAQRRVLTLVISDEDMLRLNTIARSRTESASRVERARMLLAYRDDSSFFAVGRALGVHHQTVQRCIERAIADGAMAALDDRPRPGKEPTITNEAKVWLVSLACRKAKELGYPHELWTTALLARHAREHGPAAGHGCLARLAQGTVCKILDRQAVKPHKVRYYLERRDAEFEAKMAEVLCVYREVAILKEATAAAEPNKPVAVVSYDEKPGIQAIATTAPDLPPQPGRYSAFARDHEYKRLGTLSLLAGIDLLTGRVHALVKDRHRSREFVEFLKLLNASYPADTTIKLILDNHSAHISKETKAWLAAQPAGRFTFTFTPKHGSWLNLIEGFFSKLARSVLRHIRVASKHELKERILAGIDDVNRHPVAHTWSYMLNNPA
jgi:transposase